MRIFLAEDEQDLNAIIVQKLTEDGYSVDHCFDGRTAIDILSCTEYDAVILDIMMPKQMDYSAACAEGNGKDNTGAISDSKGCCFGQSKGIRQWGK